MKVDFSRLKETVIPNFMGGKGNVRAWMWVDERGKIMQGSMEPGASIGLHTHTTSSEIVYILSGTGKALYDEGEELLAPGDCHYCPKGHSHSLINNGTELLVFFAVVPNQ